MSNTLHAWLLTEAVKVKMGRIFVEIATDPEKKKRFPCTPEEGLQFLQDAAIGVKPEVQKVSFHVSEIPHMHITIPPVESINAALEIIRDNELPYGIPDTYRQIADGSTELSREEQFYFRVGDYTMTHCT